MCLPALYHQVLNSIFKSSVVENKEVLDPLGLGAIDLAQMQLVRACLQLLEPYRACAVANALHHPAQWSLCMWPFARLHAHITTVLHPSGPSGGARDHHHRP